MFIALSSVNAATESFGQRVSTGLGNLVLGMLVVFAVLTILWIVLEIVGKIFAKSDAKAKAAKEAEKAEKRNSLKTYAMKSGFISEEEISENSEIAEMVENLNEAGIKAIIAERFMASLSSKVETSSVETASAVSVDLNSEEDENNILINPVQAYLN